MVSAQILANPMQHRTLTIVTPLQASADGYNIRLPVLPWVRKVMVAEFGPEPIRINGRSVLGKHMEALPFDLPEEDERPELETVGSSVMVNVSARLWGNVQTYNQLFQAGYYFEKMFQRMMISHVKAQSRHGIPDLTAIRDWFEMYDLDIDDDYNIDAARELWKAYKAGRKTLCE